MPQQQQGTNEIQGAYTREFGGLDTSQALGGVDPGASPVFHNCDISPDGAVVRRGGSQIISTLDLLDANPSAFTTSVKTRAGSEYLVLVSNQGIIAGLYQDSQVRAVPVLQASVTKFFLWTKPLTSVSFIPLTAPYDKLLILTPEHPIVQVSFLERTLDMTCTAVAGFNATFTAASSPNDSTLWYDINASSYIVTNAAGTVLPVVSKASGFNITLTVSGVAVSQVLTLTLRQITWQWWAESQHHEGGDFAQSVSRFNVTDVDQSVKVPARLLTDLPPLYKNSTEFGLSAYQDGTYGTYTKLSAPTNENTYTFTNGGRYVLGTAAPIVAPFFATFGARQTAGGVGQVFFYRIRLLHFNGNKGAAGNDVDIYVNDLPLVYNTNYTLPDSWQTQVDAYTATTRTLTPAANGTIQAKYFAITGLPVSLASNAQVEVTNTATVSYFLGAQRLWYRALPTGGGTLDGTYVRAYGISQFVDYSKRSFHTQGTLYRDRLVLLNPSGARDQLLVSEVGDTTVPGEFYTFYQVDDALEGVVTDPFTVNVTNDSRERITALVGWQNNIFVFTNSNSYAISTGEQFGPDSYNVSLVSTYGAFNPNCVLVTNLTVLYMNRYGLFDLLNKQNTSQYGAAERSSKVRSLFNRDLIDSTKDGLHWLHYNESTNKLQVGLALIGDVTTTSRNLLVNLTWESWSTLSSAAPLRMFKPFQLFSYTVWFAEIASARYFTFAAFDMPHYLDFASFIPVQPYPTPFQLPLPIQTITFDSRGIAKLFSPVVPGLTSWSIDNASPSNASYVKTSPLVVTTPGRMRNALLDFPTLAPLLGGANTGGAMVGMVTFNGEPYTLYPVVGASGSAIPISQAVLSVNGLTTQAPLAAPGAASMVGALYQSVYASPVFDLDALGRLKRLKRLHLQFDTTITQNVFYPVYSGVSTLNAAFVSLVSNYNEQTSNASVQLVGDALLFDAAQFDVPTEVRGTQLTTLPLEGYGCTYQFYVASVGAEAFKLASYEFDIIPQRNKRYTPRRG